MKEKVAVLIKKQVAADRLQPDVYKRGKNYLPKRSRKVFIMSCVIVSRS
mgnify:CR=1 FL=1